MKPLDQKLLRRFIALAGERLAGDWVLLGGTVLPLLGVSHRTTTDIDIVGIGANRTQDLALMQLAQDLGLPVESINQAALFFLHQIKDWKDHLILLHQGPNAALFRPDVTLFLELKIKRLTESDLSDALAFVRWAKKQNESLDIKRITRLLRSEMKRPSSPERTARLKELLSMYGSGAVKMTQRQLKASRRRR